MWTLDIYPHKAKWCEWIHATIRIFSPGGGIEEANDDLGEDLTFQLLGSLLSVLVFEDVLLKTFFLQWELKMS